jgi:surface polysaccharide O-acyltransferase-like enzyme
MKKSRQANFELLRIVAMLMVITLHYLVKGGMTESAAGGSEANSFALLLEAFCLVAVNCYVLISGYFLVESAWKPGRVVSLLCQILFYSLLIPVVLMVFGLIPAGSVRPYQWVEFVFPVNSEQYWFATAYLLMYLFAPFLAAGIRQMEQKQLLMVLGLLLFFECAVKSFVPMVFATDNSGYDFGWFLCLFVTAGYIRRFGFPWLEKKSHAVLLYVLTSLAAWVGYLLCERLVSRFAFLGTYKESIYSYNHILCLLGAVSLFYVFKNCTIREGKATEWICRLSPYTFGVYLLHEHVLVRYRWLEWVHAERVAGTWSFVPHMIGCVILVYVVGTCADVVREKVFVGLKNVGLHLHKSSN